MVCLFVCAAQRTFDTSSRALRVTHEALEGDRKGGQGQSQGR